MPENANNNATNANSTTAVNGNGPNLYVSNNNNATINFIRKLEEKESAYNEIKDNLKRVKNRNTLKKIDNRMLRELHDIRWIITKPNEHTSLFSAILNKYIDLLMISSRLKKHFNYKFVPSTKTLPRGPYSKRNATRKTRRK